MINMPVIPGNKKERPGCIDRTKKCWPLPTPLLHSREKGVERQKRLRGVLFKVVLFFSSPFAEFFLVLQRWGRIRNKKEIGKK
jgi:hypothetical protein